MDTTLLDKKAERELKILTLVDMVRETSGESVLRELIEILEKEFHWYAFYGVMKLEEVISDPEFYPEILDNATDEPGNPTIRQVILDSIS